MMYIQIEELQPDVKCVFIAAGVLNKPEAF